MHTSQREVMELLAAALSDLNEQLPESAQLGLGENAPLLGDGGGLDSLAMINLVAAIEEKIEARYNIYVAVSSQDVAAEGEDPWQTVGTMANFLTRRINASLGA